MGPDLIGIGGMGVALGMFSLTSAAEAALFSLTPADRLRVRRASRVSFEAAEALLRHPRRLMVLIVATNTLMSVLYFVLASVIADRRTSEFAAAGIGIGAVLIHFLVGEIVPKSLAVVARVPLVIAGALAVRFFERLTRPLNVLVDVGVVRPLARLISPQANDRTQISAEELDALLHAGATRGVIDEGEQKILTAVASLGSVRVREIMRPRVDLDWIDETAGAETVAIVVRAGGHRRLPVVRESIDGGVVGILDAMQFLGAHASGKLRPTERAGQRCSPPIYVPDSARVNQLVDLLRDRATPEALCVNESGVVTGLVSVSDVVTMLVPEARGRDEDSIGEVVAMGPGRWSVPGRLSVRDWGDMLPRGTRASRQAVGRASTIGGVVLAGLGRVPKVGDYLTLGSVRLQVEAMEGTVVERVLVSLAGERLRGEAP